MQPPLDHVPAPARVPSGACPMLGVFACALATFLAGVFLGLVL